MRCESCNIREITIEELSEEGQNPFRLCIPCHMRLKSNSLRPLEFFNLTCVHGHGSYLHDDFYDYDTGEATQPDADIVDIDKFPFPTFGQIKNNLNRLIDFSIVQYFSDDIVINQLLKFEKFEVLKRLEDKVRYNRAINYKAYEIAGKVVGRAAEEWIKKEWLNKQENELPIFAEPIVKCLEIEEAYEILTKELEKKDDKYLSQNISALLYLKSEKTLNWIEKNSYRIKNVSSNWGQLAASSMFSWEIANKWLAFGRPLSLIALDSLIFCTSTGKRLNQSLWLRELNPRLLNSPNPELIAKRLQEFLLTDSVPRTKNSVNSIITNVFETGKK